MSSKQRYLLIVVAICLLIAVAVTTVIVLRQRAFQGIENETLISPGVPSPAVGRSSPTLRRPASSGADTFTPEEQQRRDEVRRLQQTLPKDLRELWTPEFRRAQDNPTRQSIK